MSSKILFFSSSVGLGHITRDVYLAGLMDYADITWVTSGNAVKYLSAREMDVHPISYELKSIGDAISCIFPKGILSLSLSDARKIYALIKANADIIRESIDFDIYDCIISDEAWELFFIEDIPCRKVFITDFTFFKPKQYNIIQWIVYWILNRAWRSRLTSYDLRFYIGLRKIVNSLYLYYGCIPTHRPVNRRVKDGYILINIGGTASGNYILNKILDKLGKLYDVRIIGGPTYFDPDPLPKILDARLIFTLAGYSSLLELILFRKRGVIIPLKGHFEQEDNAELFRGRRGYRVIDIEELPKINLVNLVEELMEEDVDPPQIIDGSREIAKKIREFIVGK